MSFAKSKSNIMDTSSSLPESLKYTPEHEWIKRQEKGGTAYIGITDYAQAALGDVTFVELPEIGRTFKKGEIFGVVESVKAASDLYMPVSGKVLAINPKLEDQPELVNHSPYTEGWLLQIQLEDEAKTEWAHLLSAEAYTQLIQ